MDFFILIGLPTDGWGILQGRHTIIEPRFDSTIHLILQFGNLIEILRQFLAIHSGFSGNLTLNRQLLSAAIISDIRAALIAILLCRSITYIHITIDVEECLIILLIHTIFHVLPIGKGIAVDAVIEADGWRIGIYRREDKAVLTFYIGSITALIEHITFSRYVACRSAIGIREVDIMIFLSFQLYRVFITTDYQSPIEVIAILVISALSDVE